MAGNRQAWAIWGGVALALGLLVAVLWSPLRVAWSCYRLHDAAPREQARVVEKLPQAVLALRVEEGPHAGQACTADTSVAIHQATERGQVLEVVYVDWKPGTCELVSTLEASAHFLRAVLAVLAAIALGLILLGRFLQRTLTLPGEPARRLAGDARDVRCPSCGKAMDEGYLPLLAGIHWRRIGDPVGLPHALRGLPGTVGWRGRPRLHAFRCVPCEVLTVQYGDPPTR
ncbi:MAG: PF20097 family protein [Myxococcota bacterium]